MKQLSVLTARVSLLALSMLYGCGGPPISRVEYKRVSPNGNWRAELVVFEPKPWSDQRIKLVLYGPRSNQTIWSNETADVSLCFAEIVWSADSRILGAIVRNCYGRQAAIFSYDVESGTTIPSKYVETALRDEIRKNYPTWTRYRWGRDLEYTTTPDPLQFALTDEAQQEFSRRAPQDQAVYPPTPKK